MCRPGMKRLATAARLKGAELYSLGLGFFLPFFYCAGANHASLFGDGNADGGRLFRLGLNFFSILYKAYLRVRSCCIGVGQTSAVLSAARSQLKTHEHVVFFLWDTEMQDDWNPCFTR